MKTRNIKAVSKSNFVNMGPIRLRQPIPSFQVNDVDPFILLHHYGPYEINKKSNPFDLGPHPHRGFEPITFLIQGEQLHRDSLGNQSVVKAGDVQWTTAGNGIVHAEGPTKDFIDKGGVLEGIQLWLNLPSSHKMMAPVYQHVKDAEMPVVNSEDGKVTIKVVAGNYHESVGRIQTQTPVNVFWGKSKKQGLHNIPIEKTHQVLLYLINGSLLINGVEELTEEGVRMVVFDKEGEGFLVQSLEDSEFVVLSGESLNEKVVSHGPFVMNTQQEIQEAMIDYHLGKMGSIDE